MASGHRAGLSPSRAQAGGRAAEEQGALTLGDAVFSWQEALLEKALQHGADRRTVHQLQHEEVGLQQSEGCYMEGGKGGAREGGSGSGDMFKS